MASALQICESGERVLPTSGLVDGRIPLCDATIRITAEDEADAVAVLATPIHCIDQNVFATNRCAWDRGKGVPWMMVGADCTPAALAIRALKHLGQGIDPRLSNRALKACPHGSSDPTFPCWHREGMQP